MSKEQMIQARELIKQRRYGEARALLQQIDHDLAREWLAKLDEITPPAAPKPAPAVVSVSIPVPELGAEASLRDQMQAAHDLIMAKDYIRARALLQQIDHPTAHKWLAKLGELAPQPAPTPALAAPPVVISPPVAAAPVPAPAPVAEAAEPAGGLPREEQEARLIEAQELILSSKFEAAMELLEGLTLPEARLWRDKTQMNKFREFQSLWLDLYYYDVPAHQDPVAWRCSECGRDLAEASTCPQRGHKPCPLVIKERPLEEPNRLALVLGSIYIGQTRNIKVMLKDVSVTQLAQWRAHLERQLNATWEKDVRQPVLETAIMLLHQLEQTRRLQH